MCTTTLFIILADFGEIEILNNSSFFLFELPSYKKKKLKKTHGQDYQKKM